MKKDIHPKNYRLVAFKDMSNGYTFITRSTAQTRETVKLDDGIEYPLIKLEISNTSHPFFTGKMKFVDTAGRVDKYYSKYKKHIDKKEKSESEAISAKEEELKKHSDKKAKSAPEPMVARKEEKKPGDKKAKSGSEPIDAKEE